MPDAPPPLDLDAIEADLAEYRTYNFGLYQADRLAHEHAPALVEEVKRLRDACKTLGGVIDRQCIDIAKIARSEHLVSESGDADWGVIWEQAYEIADRAEKAEAEVARPAARPAPAWDEDALTEAVESVLESDWHGEYTCDCTTERCPTVPCPTSTPVYVTSARDILAIVRDHLPVKPGREDVYRAWHGTEDPWGGCADSASIERALDLLPGRSEAEVKAEGAVEALREAARKADALGIVSGSGVNVGARASAWLNTRADRLAAEGGADRG